MNIEDREAHVYALGKVAFGTFFFLVGAAAATFLQAVVQ